MQHLTLSTIWLCLLAAAAAASPAAETSPVEITESDEGFLFSQGDRKVLFYQRQPKTFNGTYRRANYVHPLYDLDGNVLTEDFPADHRHHRGIYWAWHQIFVGQQRVGDPWVTKDFAWDVRRVKVLPDDSQSAAVRAVVLWKSPQWVDDLGKQQPLLRETTLIRVHRAEGDTRKIDFEIRLVALVDHLRLGGSDDEKGYGGFSTRIRLPDDVRFTGIDGVVVPQKLSVEASPWMDLSATFAESSGVSGVTTLCHPSLPGFPQRWILRDQRSMQNPVYPGRHPIDLAQGEPLILRYRLVLHRGAAQADLIQKWQAEYGAKNSGT